MSETMPTNTLPVSEPTNRHPHHNAMAWMDHLMAYKKSHPTSSLKDCMKQAKLTYTKKGSGYEKKDKASHLPNPWMVHIAAWRAANPDWKSTMTYKQVLELCKASYKNV
jgi:hypothetical protein